MATSRKKIRRVVRSFLVAVALLIVIAVIWLYTGQMTNLKTKIFTNLPLPMALVSGHPVYVSEFFARQNLSQKLGASVSPAQIYAEILNEAKLGQVASSQHIQVSQNEIEQDYQARLAESSGQPGANFERQLSNYGIDKDFFEKEIIKPELESTNLRVWFYGQEDLNPDAYQFARTLVAQIKDGTDMGILAAQYSQDQSGQDLEGDTGFIDPESLLPELREPVSKMASGDVAILPSRLGLQVIKLENKSGNLVQLRQIFISGADFNQWLAGQEKKVSVINFLD